MTKKEFLRNLNKLITTSTKKMRENAKKVPEIIELSDETCWGDVKDAMIVLLQEEERQWGPLGCTDSAKRASRKQTKKIYQRL